MKDIMNMAMAAFTGTHAIEAIIISLVLALIMGSLVQDLLFAIIAVAIQTFLPVVYDVVHTGNASNVGKTASDIAHGIPANWEPLLVTYVGYLIIIGVLFLIKSVLFRR